MTDRSVILVAHGQDCKAHPNSLHGTIAPSRRTRAVRRPRQAQRRTSRCHPRGGAGASLPRAVLRQPGSTTWPGAPASPRGRSICTSPTRRHCSRIDPDGAEPGGRRTGERFTCGRPASAGDWPVDRGICARNIGDAPQGRHSPRYHRRAALSRACRVLLREVIARVMETIRAMLRRAHERGELKTDALVQFPQLLAAPGIVAIIWSGLFDRLSPIDVDAMMRALSRCAVRQQERRMNTHRIALLCAILLALAAARSPKIPATRVGSRPT